MISDHALAVITTGLFATIVAVLVAILVAVLRLPRDTHPDVHDQPGKTVTIQPGEAIIRPPTTPVTEMTIRPAVPTDTQLIPAVDPDDLGIDIVRLNRKPRPIKAGDLIDRYRLQHPPERP